MPGLIKHRMVKRSMAKRRDDRGAVAVWVAILLVPLMIIAALAIDISAMNVDRQRLQTGADAAALAIAADCAAGNCDPAVADITANDLAFENNPFGSDASAEVTILRDDWVQVQTTSDRDLWFGGIIPGQAGSVGLAATGAASWGAVEYPTGGTGIPLALYWCEIAYWAGLGADDVIREDGQIVGLDIPDSTSGVFISTKGKDGDFHGCPSGTAPEAVDPPGGPRGVAPPGGFGWLTSGSDCEVSSYAGGYLPSETGRSPQCSHEALKRIIDEQQVALLPLYSATNGEGGSNGAYWVFGYIAFQLEGYSNNKGSYVRPGVTMPTCPSSNDCIYGTILGFTSNGHGFETDPDGPQLGGVTMPPQLRLPEEG